jgi:uncharacterized protein YkwD
MDPFWTSDDNSLSFCNDCGEENCVCHERFWARKKETLVRLMVVFLLVIVSGSIGFLLGRNADQSTVISEVPPATLDTKIGIDQTSTTVTTPNEPLELRADEQEMIDSVNRERAQVALESLSWCPALALSSTAHSEDMATRDYFEHASPEGEEVWDRAKEQGYDYSTVGENIAVGQRSVSEVMTGWMNSPGHKANILKADYTHFGYGRATGIHEGDAGYIYWTQNFGAGGDCNPSQ